MKNYGDLGGCYLPQPTASMDNTLLDLHNSSQDAQPHSSIVWFQKISITPPTPRKIIGNFKGEGGFKGSNFRGVGGFTGNYFPKGDRPCTKH